MDAPFLYKREISQTSTKTIEINNGNMIRFSQCTGLALTFFILSIIFIPGLLGKILCLVIIVIVYIISLYMIEKKLEIIKDSLNKKIIVKIMNYLCRAKTTLIIDQENIHFSKELSNVYNIIKPFEKEKETNLLYYTFYIINDYKNLVDIDLNESNIRRKPVKCIYSFEKVHFGCDDDYIVKLNEFVGVSKDCSLFSFNINSYLVDNNLKLDTVKSFKYNYFSEHFFSYKIINEKNNKKLSLCQICILIFTTFVIIFAIPILTAFVLGIIDGIYINALFALIFVLLIILFLYFMYDCYNSLEGKIKRIDFIFSKDFNTIFIGLVKYTETKYVATFEFQKNNITTFFYESADNNFNLKVQFKNNETQQICTLKKQTQLELEALICFLNGGFMTHTYNQNNSAY